MSLVDDMREYELNKEDPLYTVWRENPETGEPEWSDPIPFDEINPGENYRDEFGNEYQKPFDTNDIDWEDVPVVEDDLPWEVEKPAEVADRGEELPFVDDLDEDPFVLYEDPEEGLVSIPLSEVPDGAEYNLDGTVYVKDDENQISIGEIEDEADYDAEALREAEEEAARADRTKADKEAESIWTSKSIVDPKIAKLQEELKNLPGFNPKKRR